MYNLLVTARDGAWDLPAYEYTRDRFLEYTNDKERTLFKVLTAEHIELLKSFPCLFAYEGESEPVRVGYIRSLKERSRSIMIEYDFESDISPIQFLEIAPIRNLLDIGEWEMNRTHWAIKDEDLFGRLHSAGLADRKFVNPVGRAGKLEELRFKVAFSFPGEVRESLRRSPRASDRSFGHGFPRRSRGGNPDRECPVRRRMNRTCCRRSAGRCARYARRPRLRRGPGKPAPP